MSVSLRAVTFDALDPGRLGRFWSELLGRPVRNDRAGVLLPGPGAEVGLGFAPSRQAKDGRNRVHLHVTSTSADDQQRLVANALELGASHLDVGQTPDEGHVVLADPEGNELCVIEPDNAYLAGTGRLGELACEGSREVGAFWSTVLGWPLVWDQDGETAVQSPRGGTKVAWGGPPVAPIVPTRRQRLDLVATAGGLRGEIESLVSRGATMLDQVTPEAALLADPDGNEFRVRAG